MSCFNKINYENKRNLVSLAEKAMAPHSSTLAWKIPWREEPGRLRFMESLSQTRLSSFTFTFHFHALEKEMATHSSVLAWRIPGMGEPGGLLSMGSHRVGHNWSELAVAAAVSLEWRIYAFFSSLWCSPLHFCSVKIFISLYQYVFNICYNSVHHCIHPAPWPHRLLRIGLLYQELLSAKPLEQSQCHDLPIILMCWMNTYLLV